MSGHLTASPIHPDPSQEPGKSEFHAWLLELSAIKEQGFCEAVAAQIEDPQRGSTSSIYETSVPILQAVPQ